MVNLKHSRKTQIEKDRIKGRETWIREMIDRSSKGMGENRRSRKRKREKGFGCKNYENAIGVFIRFSYEDNYKVKKRERERTECVSEGFLCPLPSVRRNAKTKQRLGQFGKIDSLSSPESLHRSLSGLTRKIIGFSNF